MNAAILEELSLEDRINEEVRVILDAYQEDMRRTGASYAEMFKKVKQELAREVQGGAVRLSRDKLNKLAHVVADTLAETDECEFLDDRNTIRQEARKALEKLLTEEMKIDAGSQPEDRFAAQDHCRRQPGVGHPLPQVLQR